MHNALNIFAPMLDRTLGLSFWLEKQTDKKMSFVTMLQMWYTK